MKLSRAESANRAPPDGTSAASTGSARLTVAVTANSATRFVVTGSATQTAGTSQVATVTATDAYGNTDTAYSGNHTLTVTGASSSTSPVTAPTFRDRNSVDQPFGSANTSLTFISGAGTGAMFLYKTENATIAVTDGTLTAAGADRLSVAVTAADPTRLVVTGSGSQTTGAAQTVTVTAADPYGNTDLTYSGSKNLTYSGANSSTNPVTAPTMTNNAAVATSFGSTTTNTFTNGVSNTAGGVGSMKLYKVETANIAVTDGTITATTANRLIAEAGSAHASTPLTQSGSTRPSACAKQTVTVTATDPYGNTD